MPRWEWCFRADTTVRWHGEGLPSNVPSEVGWVRHFGFDRGCGYANGPMAERLGVDVRLMPDFSEPVVDENDRTALVRNAWGALVRVSKVGESIPQSLSFSLQTREDFGRFRASWDPSTPARYPEDWEERKRRWEGRDYPVCAWTYGWYGLLRELMGVEGLSLAFHEDAALVEEISEFWGDFLIQVFDRALREVDVDYLLFWEDLAYKNGPLLSPAHFRRFFLPHYRRVIEHFRSVGLRLLMVDSDGNIESIVPLWLEAGINMLAPFEVDAGMDVVKVRQRYGDSMALIGGVNKRQVALGPAAARAELHRRLTGMGDTGYIATLDHSPIPETSYADYVAYLRLRNRLCEADVVTPGESGAR